MTEKEHKVEAYKQDVLQTEAELNEASRNMKIGLDKYEADIAKATATLAVAQSDFRRSKADAEKDMSRLNSELDRARIRLQREKLCLRLAESQLEQGFDA